MKKLDIDDLVNALCDEYELLKEENARLRRKLRLQSKKSKTKVSK